MFNFVRIISKINPAITIMPKIANIFSIDVKSTIDSSKSARHSIANDWRKIGRDMERGLVKYDRDLTRHPKISGTNK